VSSPGVADRAAALRAERVPFVHARVVRAQRPTSAKPGDEAIVFADGTMEGFVGGTCAESTVRAQSLRLLDSGEPLLLRISPEPVEGSDVAAEGALTVHNPCLSGGTIEIFLEPVVPAPLVLVHGDSPIARALTSVGDLLGYRVTTWDQSALPSTPVAAVVIASHGRDEELVVNAALSAQVPYIGLVASRKRGEAVLASLPATAAGAGRVHTPAGLDIGARTPEEVAVSILAEIVAERRRPSGRPVEARATTASDSETTIDPVCGMSVAAVDASLHLDHEGVRYWFCGTGCLRAFGADPASYLPA
jgi:xanthine dehydrogenase accessory factor